MDRASSEAGAIKGVLGPGFDFPLSQSCAVSPRTFGMSPLLRVALETLEEAATAPGIRSVACSTLLSAMDNAVEVPPGSHMACWRYLLESDHGASSLHRHEIQHPEVARDAVRVLLDPEAGETAQDLAMAALRGGNVAAVVDEDIVTLADRVFTEGRSRRVNFLIQQVHEYRGLHPNFISGLRDRLAGSDDVSVRAASVDVGALLPRLDVTFASRMFRDGSAPVRAAISEHLERVDPLDRDRALRLIRDQLEHETHRSVLSQCYAALATLIRRRPGSGDES